MIAIGRQIAAARALLGWTQADLARAAGLHRNAVAYWEAAAAIPTGQGAVPAGVRWMREAMERAGVEFSIRPSPGVRLCTAPNSVGPESGPSSRERQRIERAASRLRYEARRRHGAVAA
jgi:hypothetical protein